LFDSAGAFAKGDAMIESTRRHLRAVLIGAVVVVLVLPLVMIALATTNSPGQATATRGPIQALCQGIDDPHFIARTPALPVIAEIHDGLSAAYLLAGPAPGGLTYVNLCRTTNGNTFAESSGGAVGPPISPLLSLDLGGSTSSEVPGSLYAGHVGPAVTRVEAAQVSGVTVEAKVMGGWYLIWTRTGDDLVRITAFDAAGAVVHSLEDAKGLMPPR
jgi:hypothetical protein